MKEICVVVFVFSKEKTRSKKKGGGKEHNCLHI